MKSVYINYDEPLKIQMAMDYLKDSGINPTHRSDGVKFRKPVEVFVNDEDYEKALEIINNAETLTMIATQDNKAVKKFQIIFLIIAAILALIAFLLTHI